MRKDLIKKKNIHRGRRLSQIKKREKSAEDTDSRRLRKKKLAFPGENLQFKRVPLKTTETQKDGDTEK